MIPLSLTERVAIFWASEAPKALGSGRGSCYQACFLRRITMPDITVLPEIYPDRCHPLDYHVPHETVMFTLTARDYGTDQNPRRYVAVTSGDFVIVDPFPLEDLASLPDRCPFKDA